MDIGVALGTVILSAIVTATSYAFMYRVSSLCMVLFLIIYIVHIVQTRNKHKLSAIH